MRKFEGYEEVKVNTGFGERLKLGGHVCKILEVKIEQFTGKKDGKTYETLVVKFDIEAPDEQAGFYAKKFTEDAAKDALTAKWKGYHRISVPTGDSEDFIKSNFKAFITSVEESNPGYEWCWEENTLVGKTFGGVFGFEEFVAPDGRTITMTKIRFVRSTNNVANAGIPKVKLADKTLIDYDEYIEMRKQNKENGNSSATEVNTTQTDELPF